MYIYERNHNSSHIFAFLTLKDRMMSFDTVVYPENGYRLCN